MRCTRMQVSSSSHTLNLRNKRQEERTQPQLQLHLAPSVIDRSSPAAGEAQFGGSMGPSVPKMEHRAISRVEGNSLLRRSSSKENCRSRSLHPLKSSVHRVRDAECKVNGEEEKE